MKGPVRLCSPSNPSTPLGLKSSLMADASNKLPWKKNLLLFFCSVAIVSAGRVREVAGFSLEIKVGCTGPQTSLLES